MNVGAVVWVGGAVALSAALPPYQPLGQVLSLSPVTVSFGTVAIGSSSSPQAITLTNSGNNRIHIQNIVVSGDFTQTSTCGSTLSANANCRILVSFKPTASGTRTGTVTIQSNVLVLPLTALLSGTAVDLAQVTTSASELTFPNQNVGTRSSPQTITLSNPGTAPLTISSIKTTGDFSQTNNCGASLARAANCTISVVFQPAAIGQRSGSLTIADDAAGAGQGFPLSGIGETANSNITAVWANEGGDKVSQDELRASRQTENLTGKVLNSVWNGTTITLSGAHNEVVDFNLVLEAAQAKASDVSVKFDTLTGPGGATIVSTAATGDGVFTWVGRPIDLFYVRYLQINGLSYFGYGKSDERQIPLRFQTPWTGNGVGTNSWTDRPDHSKFYPDIMVPLELVPTFAIAQGQNQSIWSDIYIPKTSPSGIYSGQVVVQENGITTHTIPVQLTVNNFTLPDTPTTRTMIVLDTTDIEWRYVTGRGGYEGWNSPGGRTIQQVTDKYYQLFHRHKISVLGENECPIFDHPCDSSLPRLDGSLFTAAKGYDGPGVNTPNGIFSIGTYGTWGYPQFGIPGWRANRSLFQTHIDSWATWFEANSSGTDYFLYLQDEPHPADYAQVETWSQWIAQDPGPGKRLRSMATVDAAIAQTSIPSLDLPVTHAGLGKQDIVNFYNTTPGRNFWLYNDGRPAVGTFDTEDDGVSPRTLPWAQYKTGVDRWFYWYANLNSNIDWYTQATTWGYDQYFDHSIGWTSDNGKTNGDGVLVYPGTDLSHPANSYGVHGPFASLRLKEWRRGLQDADYLALANQIDPTTTQRILNTVLPRALWEYNTADPSSYTGGVSWSTNPDDWEAGRAQLAQIITNWCTKNPSSNYCTGN